MPKFKTIKDYLSNNNNEPANNKLLEILNWINEEFPNLKLEIKWNQPMIIMDNTHIISFSMSKEHLSVAPEFKTMTIFSEQIKEAGYSQSKMLFRIKYIEKVNYDLLRKMIEFNMKDKAGLQSFWRIK